MIYRILAEVTGMVRALVGGLPGLMLGVFFLVMALFLGAK
jgi:hypothetical protein